MEHKVRPWHTIDTEYLIRRPWLTARRDRVELPDGRINNEFYVLEYPSWVNIIAITGDGRFVLVEQYRQGLGRLQFELCAGVVEDGETPLEGARRELLEETGYTGGTWSLISVISGNPSTTNNLTYCFVALGVSLSDSQHLDSTEDIAVHLVTRDELLALMKSDEMKQSLMLASLWKYFAAEAMGFDPEVAR